MIIISKNYKNIFSAQFFVPMPENQQILEQTAQPSTNSLSYGTVPYNISSENMVKYSIILYSYTPDTHVATPLPMNGLSTRHGYKAASHEAETEAEAFAMLEAKAKARAFANCRSQSRSQGCKKFRSRSRSQGCESIIYPKKKYWHIITIAKPNTSAKLKPKPVLTKS